MYGKSACPVLQRDWGTTEVKSEEGPGLLDNVKRIQRPESPGYKKY